MPSQGSDYPREEGEGECDEVLDPEVMAGELLDGLGVPGPAGKVTESEDWSAALLLGVEDLHAGHEGEGLDAPAHDEELLHHGEQRVAGLEDDQGVVPALEHHLVEVQVGSLAEVAGAVVLGHL